MSAWKEYKNKTKPWDLLNPNVKKVDNKLSEKRLKICQQCPELIKLTNQCKKCGCFMNLKVKLENASCPIEKW